MIKPTKPKRERPPKPPDLRAEHFVRSTMGRRALAPLTGGDWRAFRSFCHLLECWAYGGGDNAVAALRATLRCAQPSVLRLFLQAIPGVLDWGHVVQLWPRLADEQWAEPGVRPGFPLDAATWIPVGDPRDEGGS